MGTKIMDVANLVLTAISTLAAVVSAITAIRAKSELHKLKNSISGNNNTQFSGNVTVNNKGRNDGILSGVNNGVIRK